MALVRLLSQRPSLISLEDCWSILDRRGVNGIAVYAPDRITRPSSEPYGTTQHPEEEDKALINTREKQLNALA